MKTTIAIKIKKKMMVDITIVNNNNNDDFNQHNEYNITTITIKHDDFSVKNLLISAVFFFYSRFIHYSCFQFELRDVLESREQVSCTQYFLKSERSWVVKPVNIPYVILWSVKLFFQDQRELPMVNSTFHLVNSNFYVVNFRHFHWPST